MTSARLERAHTRRAHVGQLALILVLVGWSLGAALPAGASPAAARSGCTDGSRPGAFQTTASADWSTITVRPRGTLCSPVALVWAAYAVPSTWDRHGWNPTALPQHLFDSTTATISGSASTELTVTLPCGNVQVDLYRPPVLPRIGPETIGSELIKTRLWHRSTCPPDPGDHQAVQVSVPAGTLAISTPYGPDHPLDLGDLQLDASATGYRASAKFDGIQVTDTRAGDLPWVVSVVGSPLGDATGDRISPQNLGLTDIALEPVPGNALPGPDGNVTVTDAPTASEPVAPGAPGSDGLSEMRPLIAAVHGTGTIRASAQLTLLAPTSSPPGTYTGTITFTIA
jgi:hypothetical protein